MLTRSATLALLTASAVGCSSGPFPAPYDAVISTDVSTVYVANSQTYWYAEGIGAAVMANVLVTVPDRASGEPVPLNNTQVTVQGPTRGVYLLPQSAVNRVLIPEADGCGNDWSDTTDGSTDLCAYSVEADGDTLGASYIQLNGTYRDAAGVTDDGTSFGPNYISGATNSRGLLPLWIFVDALPTDGLENRRGAGDVGLDTGDTGLGGTGGGEGGGSESVTLGTALISASIGHSATTITIAPAE